MVMQKNKRGVEKRENLGLIPARSRYEKIPEIASLGVVVVGNYLRFNLNG